MMKLASSLLAALTLSLPASADDAVAFDPAQPYQGVRSAPVTYQVDFSVVVTPPYKTKTLKIWLPLPPCDSAQQIKNRKLSTFPMAIEPAIAAEKVHGNTFAYFEFHKPQGAQIIRHQFQITTHEVRWHLNPDKIKAVDAWPDSFQPYLRDERLLPTDERFAKLAALIVPRKQNPVDDLSAIMKWANLNLAYDHGDCSLQGSAVHAFEKRRGHCSDYHGLCTALGRCLGYPTRIVYGITSLPKNSPSHCKLEVYLPPAGWVCFDVSETQNLIRLIQKDTTLDESRKQKLSARAQERLRSGFRDNTWYLQTRGSDYHLAPPASKKVAVVRTIYAEADGVPIPEPDPANPNQREFGWMTVHRYVPDRPVTSPFVDWRSLEQ